MTRMLWNGVSEAQVQAGHNMRIGSVKRFAKPLGFANCALGGFKLE